MPAARTVCPPLVLALTAAIVVSVTAARSQPANPSAAYPAPAAAGASVHFTAAGDFGTSSHAQAVLAGIGATAPDLNLALGDLSYGADGTEQSWCDLVKSKVGPTLPFELISGNHESNGLNGYIENFAACLPNRLPGLVGTYGKEWYVDVPAAAPLVRFIMISPNLNFGSGKWSYTVGSSHYNWTAAAIDDAHAANIPWVVVGMHEPCLSSSVTVCSSGSDLMNLLVTKHVDLVLAGHVHMYERTKQLAHSASCPTIVPGTFSSECVVDSDSTMTQGGTVFATVGTGGEVEQHPKSTDPERQYFAATTDPKLSAWGMLDVTVDDSELSASFDTTDGAPMSDSFTVDRSGAPPANSPPVAAFTSYCTSLTCTFDGTGSTDSDGTITSYGWTFGDSQAGTGPSPAHIYSSDGTYSVTLTVTDNDGATNSITHQVTVESGGGGGAVSFVAAAHGPPGSVKHQQVTVPATVTSGDTMLLLFTRSDSVTWTGPTGVTRWSQLDTFDNGSTTSSAWIKTAAATDPGSSVQFTSGTYSKGVLELAVYRGGTAAMPVFAHAGDSSRAAHATPTISPPSGASVVSWWSDKSGTTTGWSAPTGVAARDIAIGTGGGRYTALLADSDGPVSGGSYGGLTATTNTASSYADMWTIALMPTGGPPANASPTAAFTSSCTGLSCTFDGTASFDTDGTIASYAWDFGDTHSGTGPSTSHSYAAGGGYPITLTVTDDDGATDSITRQVTVSSGGGGGGTVSFVAAAQATGGSARAERILVPGIAQVGDTAVLVFTGAPSWAGPAGVTGWTPLGTFSIDTSKSWAWVKVLTAADIGSEVRMENTSFVKGVLSLAVYSGVDATQVKAGHAGDVGQTTHATGMVATTDGGWVVSVWSDKSGGTTSWTAPAGVATRATAFGIGGGRYSALVADSAGPVAAGTYGPVMASTDAVSINAAAWTIALPAGE